MSHYDNNNNKNVYIMNNLNQYIGYLYCESNLMRIYSLYERSYQEYHLFNDTIFDKKTKQKVGFFVKNENNLVQLILSSQYNSISRLLI